MSAGALPLQASNRFPNLALAYNALLPLAMSAKDVEAESVFVDVPLYAFVPGFAYDLYRYAAGAAVARGEERINNHKFELRRARMLRRFQ
jgi:hypothetical protein